MALPTAFGYAGSGVTTQWPDNHPFAKQSAAINAGVLGDPGPTGEGPWPMTPKQTYGVAEDHTEKLAAGPRGVVMPWFLPFFDDVTGETAEMRRQYRLMLRDPVVKGAALGKLFGVAALDIKITPFSDDPGDVEVSRFVEWNLTQRIRGMVPKMVESIVLHAMIDGYSVSEKVWGVEEHGRWAGKHVLRELKPKDTDRDLVLKTDEFRNIVSIMGIRYNGGLEFDPRDFVLFTHLPLYCSPAGMSDFRAVYGRYWVLDTAWKLRAAGLTNRAFPILYGEYATIDQKPRLEQALNAAKYNAFITAPQGVKVEALDIAARSQDEFRNAIADLREEIFLGIQLAMLQALTGQAGAQRGSSAAHKDTSDLAKWYLAQIFCACLNDHESGLIRDLVTRNFAGRQCPHASMSGVDDLELAESLNIDKGLKEMGWDHSVKELAERYGRKLPTEEEDRMSQLVKKYNTQAGGPGGAPGAPGGGQGGEGFEPPAGSEPPEFVDDDQFSTDWGFSPGLMERAA